MTNPVEARYGSLSATGIAVEPSFGTVTVPTSYLPMSGNALNLDIGLFYPKLQFGQRDLNVFGLEGQYKNSGAITGPLFPSNGAELIVSAIGQDAAPGNGVVGSSPTNSTTMTSLSTAGATTIQVAAVTGFVAGTTIVQIDTNTGTTATSECRRVSTITGTTSPYTLTLDSPLVYGHASASAIAAVVAPFTHTITRTNTLPSLTIEKNLGNYESLQFSGARVNKLSLTCQSSNQEATISADMMAKHAGVLATPSAISIVDESPYVFAEGTLSLFGQTVAQTESVSIDIENGLKETYTQNGSHEVEFLTPVTSHVSAKADLVFTSLDDTTWGYWQQMVNGTKGALTYTLAHAGSGGTWTFNLPQVQIKTYSDAIPMDDVVKTTLNLEASLHLSTMTTISATLANGVYTAY